MVVTPQVFDKVEAQIAKEGIEAEIVAIDTLKQVEGLRVETLTQLDRQIKAFEHVIEELEVTDISMKKLVKELPHLSKARYLALLKHEKKIAETIVVDMLIADLEFLIVVKENIAKSGLRGILNTLKKLGKLPALGVIQKSGGGGDDDDEEEEEKKK